MKRHLLTPIVALLASACASTAPPGEPFDPEELAAEADEVRGDREGTTWLRRHVTGRVDVARRAAAAESRIQVHVAGVVWDGGPAKVQVLAPPDAALDGLRARVIGPTGAREVEPTDARAVAPWPRIDPYQIAWEVTLPATEPGEVVELILDLAVPRTLEADARWLGAPDGPTKELLLRYEVPEEAVGAFLVQGAEAKPLVVEEGDHTLLALRLTDLPPVEARGPHARYATRSASPAGYDQDFTTSWAFVAGPSERELLERTEELRRNHAAPYRPEGGGREAVVAAYRWVRDRLQPEDALAADWTAGQPLPEAIRSNTLNATDKVHLLHWLLEEAGLPHRVAVARPAGFPALDPGFPVPNAFQRALVYVPEHDLWLDPGCRECEAGQVRPSLRGGQALLLPAAGEKPRTLPED